MHIKDINSIKKSLLFKRNLTNRESKRSEYDQTDRFSFAPQATLYSNDASLPKSARCKIRRFARVNIEYAI